MAWQYCDCGAELNPTPEDTLTGIIECPHCRKDNEVSMLDDERAEILKEMYRDIQELKRYMHYHEADGELSHE